MRALIVFLIVLWVVGVAYKTLRSAAWDREHVRQDAIRQGIMQRESTALSDQGWHRDSATGMWTP